MAERKIRSIGIITGGGDAPGMNAAARAVARAALDNGIKVFGIKNAYKGLVEDDMIELDEFKLSNIINRAGTFLYTDRYTKFMNPEYVKKGIEVCREKEIDVIVAIGGDGTFRGARDLVRYGMPCIGIPATIDNDMASSDYTIGFDTALNTVVNIIDSLRDTCESHARCNIVEVMGRGAGYLTVEAGIAGGATEIIANEYYPKKADDPVTDPKLRSFDYEAADKLCEKILDARKISGNDIIGKRGFIVVVSENMLPVYEDGKKTPYAEKLCSYINSKIGIGVPEFDETGVETKFVRLAHMQRGGTPTFRDRFMPSLMGMKAVELMLEGKDNVVVVVQNNEIVSIPLDYAIEMDNLTKGKKTEAQLCEEFSPETVEEMKKRIAFRTAELEYLYKTNNAISI
ncbi:MAG: ATP-dependent 6-phosphofructokinase [Ruminococcaceae bacterium]|nr:ATP-dependent 6-phosphofructokinase [Oscillospiraceae bacterium]